MVDLFFELFNFALIIGLLSYIVYRHMMPQIKQKIDLERQTFENLHEEHRQLLLSQKHLDESIVVQEADCTKFFNKINIWKDAVGRDIKNKAEESRHLLEQAQKKLATQSENYAIKELQQRVSPMVISNLEKELKGYFSEPGNAHAYMGKILNGLKV